jgi:hypothetical protein
MVSCAWLRFTARRAVLVLLLVLEAILCGGTLCVAVQLHSAVGFCSLFFDVIFDVSAGHGHA